MNVLINKNPTNQSILQKIFLDLAQNLAQPICNNLKLINQHIQGRTVFILKENIEINKNRK